MKENDFTEKESLELITRMIQQTKQNLQVGIGTAFTGVITNEKSMTYFPVISFIISIYMLNTLLVSGSFSIEWNLLCGLCFLLMLVIPRHILNRKSLKQCSKN